MGVITPSSWKRLPHWLRMPNTAFLVSPVLPPTSHVISDDYWSACVGVPKISVLGPFLLLIYAYPWEISSSLMALNSIYIPTIPKFTGVFPEAPIHTASCLQPLQSAASQVSQVTIKCLPCRFHHLPHLKWWKLQGENLSANLGPFLFLHTTSSWYHHIPLAPSSKYNLNSTTFFFKPSLHLGIKPLCVIGVGDMKRHAWLNSWIQYRLVTLGE